MKITKIKKKKRLYLIEIDNNDKLYVTEDTIVHFMLSKHMEIDTKTLQNIQTYTQLSHGKNLALYYLSFKQRTISEIIKYLKQHDIQDSYIPKIIENLKKENWVNDLQYVKTYLAQNLNTGDKGVSVLKQKLIQKGIPPQLIEQELANLDFSQLAEKVAQKLLKKYHQKYPIKALRDKMIQNMLSKGFSYSESKLAIKNLNIDNDDEIETKMLYNELDKRYQKYSKKYEGYKLKQHLIQALLRKGFTFDNISNALKDYL